MGVESWNYRESADYSNLDAKESKKEKEIRELIEDADSPIAKQEAANKMNDHFKFVSIANDLKNTFPTQATITPQDIKNFLDTKLPTPEQQEDFWQNFALWLKTEEVIFVGTGSQSYDCRNIPIGNQPMAGTQAAGEFMLRVLAGDTSWVDATNTTEIWLPQTIANSAENVYKMQAVNAGAKFNASIDAINDTDRAIKRATGEQNRELQNKKLEQESAMQRELDALSHAIVGMLKSDPRGQNKETRQILKAYKDAKKSYGVYLEDHEVDTWWNQMKQYDDRIKETSAKIYTIQVLAREDHMENMYLGSYDQAMQNITQTWVHNDFVPMKDPVRRQAMERAMGKWIPKFIAQVRDKEWIDGILTLLDTVQAKMDQNNRQSTNLQWFYKIFATVLQQSVGAEMINGATPQQDIQFFKLITGRTLEDTPQEEGKQSIARWLYHNNPITTWAKAAAGLFSYNSARIDDNVKNFDLAEVVGFKMMADSWLTESIAQQNREVMWFPNQQEFDAQMKKFDAFTVKTPDWQSLQYDVRQALGLDPSMKVEEMTLSQLKIFNTLQETANDRALANLWPNGEQANLEKFFKVFGEAAQKVEEETNASLVVALGIANEGNLSAKQKDVFTLIKDYYGQGGLFDISDRNSMKAKQWAKKIAVIGATAAVAAATAWSWLPFLWAAIVTGASWAAIDVAINQRGFDTHFEWVKFFGFNALQSVILGWFGKIPAIKNIGFGVDDAAEASIKEVGLTTWLKTVGINRVKAKANKTLQDTLKKPIKNTLGEAREALVFDKEVDINQVMDNLFNKLWSNAGMELLTQLAIDTDDMSVLDSVADKLETESKNIIPQYQQALEKAQSPQEKQAIQTMLEHRQFAGGIKAQLIEARW